jgi:hypothetical protein
MRRRGTTELPEATESERFWSQVAKLDGCWSWTGSLTGKGYGSFSATGRRTVSAHQFSYLDVVGEIPEGTELDHLCRNRACVNPDHLEPVTHRENVLRGTAPTAENARKTHCKNRHEFTPENTNLKNEGKRRECRTCKAEDNRQRYLARTGRVDCP